MDTLEFRAKCPQCGRERTLIGPFPARTPAQLDLIEVAMTGKTSRAVCPACNCVEAVAMFVDGQQVEPWQDADEMERRHGPKAGPLPRKPWPDTN